jgi:hypothetical protein
MRHSLWWLLGQFGIVVAAGTVMILGVIALWYGLSFVVLATVGRVFPLRGGKWTPADHDPTGGTRWALGKGRWTMTLDEVKQARARLSTSERDARDRTCAERGHAWTERDTEEPQRYCGRCFWIREG